MPKNFKGNKGNLGNSGGGGYALNLTIIQGKQKKSDTNFVQPFEVIAFKGKHVMPGATIEVKEGTELLKTGTTLANGVFGWEYPGEIPEEETEVKTLRFILIDLPERKEVTSTFEVRPLNEPKREGLKLSKPTHITFEAIGEKGEYLLLVYTTSENNQGAKGEVTIIQGGRDLVTKPTNEKGQLLHCLQKFDTEEEKVEVRIEGSSPIRRAIKILKGKPKPKPKPIIIPHGPAGGKPVYFSEKVRSIKDQLREQKKEN